MYNKRVIAIVNIAPIMMELFLDNRDEPCSRVTTKKNHLHCQLRLLKTCGTLVDDVDLLY